MENNDQPQDLIAESKKILSDQMTTPESSVTYFSDYKLPEKLQLAIDKIGWKSPTPIQAAALPYTLIGRDLAGFAQTGTGKTGAFLITIAKKLLTPQPIVKEGVQEELEDQSEESDATEEDLSSEEPGNKRSRRLAQQRPPQKPRKGKFTLPRAVVIAPTRELAIQISEEAAQLFDNTGLKTFSVYGGSDLSTQIDSLHRDNPDLIVATTGRLLDLVKRNVIGFDLCQVFVCDEVDRMFEMGFIDDTIFCLDRLQESAQRLIFSATASPGVKELAFEYLENPHYVELNQEEITPENIDQNAIICDSTTKLKVMIGLLRDLAPSRAIIFTNTKITAEWLNFKLQGNGFKTEVITGNLPQNQRIRLIQKIKEGNVQYLIATDIASRGLHIAEVSHIFNFDVPDEPANYIHRIGRTARAGSKGQAYTLICDYYGENFIAIAEKLGKAAPKAQWFDEKYLAIEDLAPNPMKTQETSHHRGRESSRQDSRRGGGGRNERPDRNDTRRRPAGQKQQDTRSSHDSSRTSAGRGRGENQAGSHNQRRPNRDDQNRQQRGRGNQNRSQSLGRRDEALGKSAQMPKQAHEAQKTILEKDQSSIGFLKKIFNVFFKKK